MAILVANLGTHPEVMRVASALIASGYDVVYFTGSTWASDSMLARVSQSRLLRQTWIGRSLSRRILPAEIRAVHVRHAALLWEVLLQTAIRFRSPSRERLRLRRIAAFGRAVARWSARQELDVAYCQYGSAAPIFTACSPDAIRILGYPIAHHRWMMRELGIEATANPDWAAYLQGHDFTEEQLEELDLEVSLADYVIVPSTFAAGTFIEQGVPQQKLRVVPLAPSTPMSGIRDGSGDDETARRASGGALRLIMAGQITQRKGISYSLDALSKVPDAELMLVGPPVGTILDKLRDLDRVTVVESQPKAKLAQMMRSADLLLLPSLAEGFGLVVIEAMREGTPAIVSTATMAGDLITDGINGFIVSPRSSDEIAAVLTRLASDRALLAQLSDAARLTSAKFTWDRFQSSVVAIVEEALVGRSQRQ